MISGPSREGEPARLPARELPGEFVSEDLRDDCARFLDELRTVIQHRFEPPEHDDQREAGNR